MWDHPQSLRDSPSPCSQGRPSCGRDLIRSPAGSPSPTDGTTGRKANWGGDTGKTPCQRKRPSEEGLLHIAVIPESLGVAGFLRTGVRVIRGRRGIIELHGLRISRISTIGHQSALVGALVLALHVCARSALTLPCLLYTSDAADE